MAKRPMGPNPHNMPPQEAQRLYERAIADHRGGRLRDAEAGYRKLLKQAADPSQLWYLLGRCLVDQGRGTEGQPWLAKSVKAAPSRAERRVGLGMALLQMGRIELAEDCFAKALAQQPDSIDARYQLAVAAIRRGDTEAGERRLREVLENSPEATVPRVEFGNLLFRLDRLAEAEAEFRTVLESEPRDAAAWNGLGNVLDGAGRQAEAVGAFERALEILPNAHTAGNLGSVFTELGRVDEARAMLERALELDPDHAWARIALSGLRRWTERDDHVAWLERYAKKPKNPDVARHDAEFALGKIWLDIGDADRAFTWFASANRDKRATFDGWSLDGDRARYRAIVAACPPERIAAAGGGHRDETPIFVLGMPRSGTTLVEQILATHPDVHGAGETPAMNAVLRDPALVDSFPEGLAALSDAGFAAIGRAYVERLRGYVPAGATPRYVTDKQPTNFRFLGPIRLALPDARIVLCERDPVATCVSNFQQNFHVGNEFSYRLEDLAGYYALYREVVDAWVAAIPADRLLVVRYEDVVADLEGQARRLLAFCDLPWDDAVMRFHETRRSVKTASYLQVRQPIYRTSVRSWTAWRTRLGPLLDGLRAAGWLDDDESDDRRPSAAP